jgi:hypothetical protein
MFHIPGALCGPHKHQQGGGGVPAGTPAAAARVLPGGARGETREDGGGREEGGRGNVPSPSVPRLSACSASPACDPCVRPPREPTHSRVPKPQTTSYKTPNLKPWVLSPES